MGSDHVFVRIVSLDYYMRAPVPGVDVCFSFMEGTAVQEVPVLRIFGSTPAGQKACVHVHKAFPYFYVPWDNEAPQEPQEVTTYLRRMARTLETTMQLSHGHGGGEGQQEGQGGDHHAGRPKRQIVHNLQLVRARPYYGYHPSESLFIKVVLYNPQDVTRAAQLLGSGAITGKRMQPHESHIPFLLQFKIDFNLLGMGHIKLRRVLFREPLPPCAPITRPGWDPPKSQQAPLVVDYERDTDVRPYSTPLGGRAPSAPRTGPTPLSPPTPGLSMHETQKQARLIWIARTVPYKMRWASRTEVPPSRVPARQTLCELELDACVEDILNRREAIRVPLEEATASQHLLASLMPMWEEERERCGGELPPRPPSPPRAPRPLCAAVEAVRADLQGISRQIASSLGQPADADAPQAASPPAPAARASQQRSPPTQPKATTTPRASPKSASQRGKQRQSPAGTPTAGTTPRKTQSQSGRPKLSPRIGQGALPADGDIDEEGYEGNSQDQGLKDHDPLHGPSQAGYGRDSPAADEGVSPGFGGQEPVQYADYSVAGPGTVARQRLFQATQQANCMTGGVVEEEEALEAAHALACAVAAAVLPGGEGPAGPSQPEQPASSGLQLGSEVGGSQLTPHISQQEGFAVFSQLPAASLPYGLTQLAQAAAAASQGTQPAASPGYGLTQLAEAAAGTPPTTDTPLHPPASAHDQSHPPQLQSQPGLGSTHVFGMPASPVATGAHGTPQLAPLPPSPVAVAGTAADEAASLSLLHVPAAALITSPLQHVVTPASGLAAAATPAAVPDSSAGAGPETDFQFTVSQHVRPWQTSQGPHSLQAPASLAPDSLQHGTAGAQQPSQGFASRGTPWPSAGQPGTIGSQRPGSQLQPHRLPSSQGLGHAGAPSSVLPLTGGGSQLRLADQPLQPVTVEVQSALAQATASLASPWIVPETQLGGPAAPGSAAQAPGTQGAEPRTQLPPTAPRPRRRVPFTPAVLLERLMQADSVARLRLPGSSARRRVGRRASPAVASSSGSGGDLGSLSGLSSKSATPSASDHDNNDNNPSEHEAEPPHQHAAHMHEHEPDPSMDADEPDHVSESPTGHADGRDHPSHSHAKGIHDAPYMPQSILDEGLYDVEGEEGEDNKPGRYIYDAPPEAGLHGEVHGGEVTNQAELVVGGVAGRESESPGYSDDMWDLGMGGSESDSGGFSALGQRGTGSPDPRISQLPSHVPPQGSYQPSQPTSPADHASPIAGAQLSPVVAASGQVSPPPATTPAAGDGGGNQPYHATQPGLPPPQSADEILDDIFNRFDDDEIDMDLDMGEIEGGDEAVVGASMDAVGTAGAAQGHVRTDSENDDIVDSGGEGSQEPPSRSMSPQPSGRRTQPPPHAARASDTPQSQRAGPAASQRASTARRSLWSGGQRTPSSQRVVQRRGRGQRQRDTPPSRVVPLQLAASPLPPRSQRAGGYNTEPTYQQQHGRHQTSPAPPGPSWQYAPMREHAPMQQPQQPGCHAWGGYGNVGPSAGQGMWQDAPWPVGQCGYEPEHATDQGAYSQDGYAPVHGAQQDDHAGPQFVTAWQQFSQQQGAPGEEPDHPERHEGSPGAQWALHGGQIPQTDGAGDDEGTAAAVRPAARLKLRTATGTPLVGRGSSTAAGAAGPTAPQQPAAAPPRKPLPAAPRVSGGAAGAGGPPRPLPLQQLGLPHGGAGSGSSVERVSDAGLAARRAMVQDLIPEQLAVIHPSVRKPYKRPATAKTAVAGVAATAGAAPAAAAGSLSGPAGRSAAGLGSEAAAPAARSIHTDAPQEPSGAGQVTTGPAQHVPKLAQASIALTTAPHTTNSKPQTTAPVVAADRPEAQPVQAPVAAGALVEPEAQPVQGAPSAAQTGQGDERARRQKPRVQLPGRPPPQAADAGAGSGSTAVLPGDSGRGASSGAPTAKGPRKRDRAAQSPPATSPADGAAADKPRSKGKPASKRAHQLMHLAQAEAANGGADKGDSGKGKRKRRKKGGKADAPVPQAAAAPAVMQAMGADLAAQDTLSAGLMQAAVLTVLTSPAASPGVQLRAVGAGNARFDEPHSGPGLRPTAQLPAVAAAVAAAAPASPARPAPRDMLVGQASRDEDPSPAKVGPAQNSAAVQHTTSMAGTSHAMPDKHHGEAGRPGLSPSPQDQAVDRSADHLVHAILFGSAPDDGDSDGSLSHGVVGASDAAATEGAVDIAAANRSLHGPSKGATGSDPAAGYACTGAAVSGRPQHRMQSPHAHGQSPDHVGPAGLVPPMCGQGTAGALQVLPGPSDIVPAASHVGLEAGVGQGDNLAMAGGQGAHGGQIVGGNSEQGMQDGQNQTPEVIWLCTPPSSATQPANVDEPMASQGAMARATTRGVVAQPGLQPPHSIAQGLHGVTGEPSVVPSVGEGIVTKVPERGPAPEAHRRPIEGAYVGVGLVIQSPVQVTKHGPAGSPVAGAQQSPPMPSAGTRTGTAPNTLSTPLSLPSTQPLASPPHSVPPTQPLLSARVHDTAEDLTDMQQPAGPGASPLRRLRLSLSSPNTHVPMGSPLEHLADPASTHVPMDVDRVAGGVVTYDPPARHADASAGAIALGSPADHTLHGAGQTERHALAGPQDHMVMSPEAASGAMQCGEGGNAMVRNGHDPACEPSHGHDADANNDNKGGPGGAPNQGHPSRHDRGSGGTDAGSDRPSQGGPQGQEGTNGGHGVGGGGHDHEGDGDDVPMTDIEPGPSQEAGISCLWFRPRVRPPTRAEVESSWREVGLLPVVHQEPFYGHTNDVPPRPVVFAGREWRIPAADDLPPFNPHATTHTPTHAATANTVPDASGPSAATGQHTSCLDRLLAHVQRARAQGGERGNRGANAVTGAHTSLPRLGTHRPGTLTFRPLLGPPSRAHVAEWVKRQAAVQGSGTRKGGDVRLGGEIEFGMDPNTGALLPVMGAAVRQAAAGRGALSSGFALPDADTQVAGTGDVSLLGTPEVLSAEHASLGATLPNMSTPQQAVNTEPSPFDAPPSPKYDERTTFFFTGAFGMRPPTALTTPATKGGALAGLNEGDFDVSGVPIEAPSDTLATTLPSTQPITQPQPPSTHGKGTPATEAPAGAHAQATTQQPPASGVGTSADPHSAGLSGAGLGRKDGTGVNTNNNSDGVEAGAGPAGLTSEGPLSMDAQIEEGTGVVKDGSGSGGPKSEKGSESQPLDSGPVASRRQRAGVTPRTQAPGTAGPMSLFSPAHKATHPPPVTPQSQRGFKRAAPGRGEQLTCLAVEILSDCRGSLLPDPKHDALRCVVLVAWDDGVDLSDGQGTSTRILIYPHAAKGPAAAPGGMDVRVPAGQGAPEEPAAAQGTFAAAGQPPAGAAAAGLAGAAATVTVADRPAAAPLHGPAGSTPLDTTILQPDAAAGVSAIAPDNRQDTDMSAGGQGAQKQGERAASETPHASGRAPPTPQLTGSTQGARQEWAQLLQQYEIPLGGVSHEDGLPSEWQVEVYPDEASLISAVVWATLSLDPDVIIGWDVQRSSLGWIAERAAHLGSNFLRSMSRTPQSAGLREKQDDEYGRLHASGLHSTGRVLLNLWRIIRGEVKLNMYSFEGCCAAVLRRRVPAVPHTQMSSWFRAGPAGGRWRALRALRQRCVLNLLMVDTLDLLGRTAEMARAFGIDFFSVLTRGSQYRVESLMVRLAHTQNYLMVSPSREQVGGQPAMEAIPLVMEPESRLYCNPVIVLDFQSLYPSQMIAYNLCYSTCVGKVSHARAAAAASAQRAAESTPVGVTGHMSGAPVQGVRLGVTSYMPPADWMVPGAACDPESLIIAPNGACYVPPSVRVGVLPRMLREILDTRILAKSSMKKYAADRVLQRILNARQFGLKMISNVTYGYTSAGFSGRMPFAELADSIVQSARQTLENAIQMVDSHPEWRARVVYGDTDSMFVLVPGRSREEAFRIGAEIAAAVTAANPPPVTLKMEKVYHPCILQTKKRYVGFAYENPSQTVPVFDAKGIETVRRDSCPAVSKLLEASLRILFATRDLSQVKGYLTRQWSKILSNRVSIQDFVFAKEVRLGTYSAAAATIPPAAVIAARAMKADPRAEPRYAERVPYVVVAGPPGARLVDMVVEPHTLVESGGRLRLNALYYITKQILPSLERVLSLVGADVRAWFADMPRITRLLPQKRPATSLGLPPPSGAPLPFDPRLPPLAPLGSPFATGPGAAPLLGSRTIDQFYLSRHCAVCDALTRVNAPLCEECSADPQTSLAILQARVARLERQHLHMVRICQHCGGGGAPLRPVYDQPSTNPRPGLPLTRPGSSNALAATGPQAPAGPGASDVSGAAGASAAVGGSSGVRGPVVALAPIDGGVVCDSLDCGVYYERRKLWYELTSLGALLDAAEQALQ